MQKLDLITLQAYLKPRQPNAHKGNFGHVLVVGGNIGMSGAIRLAGEAALRVGAGLVSVATHPEHAAFINAARPELMIHAISQPSDLEPLFKRATVVVLGPGLGQTSWSQQLFHATLATELPLVVDADALNLLSFSPTKKENWILTPHPGEATRLLDTVETDRQSIVENLQKRFGGICILKGAGTLITDGTETILCPYGNPGMATGGMGDVLSGILGGLIAQKLMLLQAAKLGVCIHAYAGDLAANEKGQRGLIASDVFPYLRHLVNQ